jgi:glutamate/tyrosine decarboxylase-like PLP-dependent enzyme
MTDQPIREETLDPQNWDEMRALAYQMVDDMLDHLRTLRERPAWQPTPDEVKERMQLPLPHEPEGAESAYEDFKRDVLPYSMGSPHPRFWGWVISPGTPMGMMADMLAAGLNPNMGGASHVSNEVEFQVIDWCKEMLSYPAEASGLLVSGGSMANLVGLTVARNSLSDIDMRKQGVGGLSQRLMLYCSTETHSSVQKAVEMLGLGSDSIHSIPVNDAYQIEVDALEAAIAADKAAGLRPWCIVGSAATTNTASIDDLNRLADIAEREGMWYHVDGAFGALAALSPELKSMVAGMERADSLAFDLHKWFYAPFEVGCALVRDRAKHRNAFTLTPSYLVHGERGITAGKDWFSDYGFQLTRSFRALKVWLMIKTEGIDKYGRLIYQNVEQARYLKALVEAAPELELLAPVALNVVCFRFKAAGLDDDSLNALNKELLIRVQESGTAVVTGTMLKGKQAIRMCNVNHRTRREDFDLLVHEVIRTGNELVAETTVAG